jgi:hypothetical protein
MATRQERIDAFVHEGAPPRDRPLRSFAKIMLARTWFRSSADGSMANGEASKLTALSKLQLSVGGNQNEISAEP